MYADLIFRANAPSTINIASDLSNVILRPGVYASSSFLNLSGTMTFDAMGDPSAVFVIAAPGTGYLSVSSGSSVCAWAGYVRYHSVSASYLYCALQMTLVNGSLAKNIYWSVFAAWAIGRQLAPYLVILCRVGPSGHTLRPPAGARASGQ